MKLETSVVWDREDHEVFSGLQKWINVTERPPMECDLPYQLRKALYRIAHDPDRHTLIQLTEAVLALEKVRGCMEELQPPEEFQVTSKALWVGLIREANSAIKDIDESLKLMNRALMEFKRSYEMKGQ